MHLSFVSFCISKWFIALIGASYRYFCLHNANGSANCQIISLNFKQIRHLNWRLFLIRSVFSFTHGFEDKKSAKSWKFFGLSYCLLTLKVHTRALWHQWRTGTDEKWRELIRKNWEYLKIGSAKRYRSGMRRAIKTVLFLWFILKRRQMERNLNDWLNGNMSLQQNVLKAFVLNVVVQKTARVCWKYGSVCAELLSLCFRRQEFTESGETILFEL